ncbi:hypothetical protein [Streptomyces tricolor]|uniref:hypothetical protein n=1 Tax=Streptomyces tricolor TaxID=68277 RepID=UPI0036E87EFE
MAADEVPAHDAPERRLTVYQALQFDETLYRRFTALHEAGHAVVAVVTGEASVSERVIAPPKTADGAGKAEAYTDAIWRSAAAHLTLLYGGVLAQQRWLHEQQLWSPLRESAVQTLARHDYAALRATGATADQLVQAHTSALALRDRHWPVIIAASELLDHNGRITGADLDTLLRQDPVATHVLVPLTLTAQQQAQARAITAASKERTRRGPTHTAEPTQSPGTLPSPLHCSMPGGSHAHPADQPTPSAAGSPCTPVTWPGTGCGRPRQRDVPARPAGRGHGRAGIRCGLALMVLSPGSQDALQLLRLDEAGERDHHALGEVFSGAVAAGRGQDIRHDVGEVGGGMRRDDVGLLVRPELGELAGQGRYASPDGVAPGQRDHVDHPAGLRAGGRVLDLVDVGADLLAHRRVERVGEDVEFAQARKILQLPVDGKLVGWPWFL